MSVEKPSPVEEADANDGSDRADEIDGQQYVFDGETYVYRDKASNSTYKFDRAKNEWVLEAGSYGFENDTHTYTDPSDGSVYIWDREKNAWFPKVDEDFMARYQMSYGFGSDGATGCAETATEKDRDTDTDTDTDTANANANGNAARIKTTAGGKGAEEPGESKKVVAKRKAQEPPTWFEVDEAHNTAIYVSGLPLDVTLEQLQELFAKCGLIARDEKGRDKIKLYRDSNGEPKGDALCTYIKVESVELALEILDGWQMRGKTLSVQRAKFQLKGEYDPALKPKRKKKDKERQRKIQEKLLDWRPDRMRGEPLKCERVVVIKNLFAPEDFDKDVQLLLEYQQDVRSECLKCGDVRKVVIYDRHPEGVAQVTFREPAEAQACVQLLNGRWFSRRKISAEIWDGKTKYKVSETDAEIEARIAKWDEFLQEPDAEGKERAAGGNGPTEEAQVDQGSATDARKQPADE